jgi:hypothetical protein
MGMYSFTQNKDNINHNLEIIEALKNLTFEIYDAVDEFNKIINDPKEEKAHIFLASKEAVTKNVINI